MSVNAEPARKHAAKKKKANDQEDAAANDRTSEASLNANEARALLKPFAEFPFDPAFTSKVKAIQEMVHCHFEAIERRTGAEKDLESLKEEVKDLKVQVSR